MKQIRQIVAVFGLFLIGLLVLLIMRPQTTSPSLEKSHSSVLSAIKQSSQIISTIVVPHFDFAKDKRAVYFKTLVPQITPKTAIVLSVNHYATGSANIQSTLKIWTFNGGQAKPSQSVIQHLVDANSLSLNDGAFLNEHGIYNVLPDVARTWPSVQMVPIIIKDTTPRSQVDTLIASLQRYCDSCLLVSSIDFSHYNPDALSQIHDLLPLRALANVDPDAAWASETDSPQSLYITVRWAKLHNTTSFTVYDHSNAGAETKAPDIETTSYILGHFSDDATLATPVEKTTTFLIGGDLMFDRGVNHLYKDNGGSKTALTKLGNRVFWGVDVPMTNLEGPISDKPIDDNNDPNNLVFNFPPDVPSALHWAGIQYVSSGNNHSLNAGKAGLAVTKDVLQKVGIQSIGQEDVVNEGSVARIDAPIPISIIAFNMLTNPDENTIESYIKKEHVAGRFVWIFPHWGIEYQPKHSSAQEASAKAWIDAGADIIIGSHPHVIQDMQVYKGKPIIYSLGNLVFDQWFSKETETGLMVGGIISKDSVQLSFFPVGIHDAAPSLLRGAEKTSVISKLIDNVSGYEKINATTIQFSRK